MGGFTHGLKSLNQRYLPTVSIKVNLGNPVMDTKATNVLFVEDDQVTPKLGRPILTRSGQKSRFSLEADAYLIKSTDVWKSLVLHKTVGWPLR